MAWWSCTVSKLRKLRKLSGRERLLLAQAWLLLPVIALCLRLFGLRRCQRVLARCAGAPIQPQHEPAVRLASCVTAGHLVRAAARYSLLGANCLPQSLTLWWLLQRRGVGVVLRIGARTEAGRLDAHAWVEYQGRPLDDDGTIAERFHPFVAPRDSGGDKVSQ